MRVSYSSRSPRQRLVRAQVERRSSKRARLVLVVLAGAAQQRADAREQLAQRERLDEVVVGAGVEPGDAVVDSPRAVSISTGVRSPPSRSRRHTSRPSSGASRCRG